MSVGWVVRLCRSWLSSGKTIQISDGRNLNGTIHLQNKYLTGIRNTCKQKTKTFHNVSLNASLCNGTGMTNTMTSSPKPPPRALWRLAIAVAVRESAG